MKQQLLSFLFPSPVASKYHDRLYVPLRGLSSLPQGSVSLSLRSVLGAALSEEPLAVRLLERKLARRRVLRFKFTYEDSEMQNLVTSYLISPYLVVWLCARCNIVPVIE